jgi:hypothetical protein
MRSRLARWISTAAFAACIVVSACSRPSSFDRASALLDQGHFREAAKLFAEAKSDPQATNKEGLDATVGCLASMACAGDAALASAYLEIAHEHDGDIAQVAWRRAVPTVLRHKAVTDVLQLIESAYVGTDDASHKLLHQMMETLAEASHQPYSHACGLLAIRCEFPDDCERLGLRP